MIKMLKDGYAILWEYKWMVLPLYIVHGLYGLLVGTKIKSAISTALGVSATRTEIENGYDSDIFTDLITHMGLDPISILKTAAIGLPILLLLSVFVNGGLIANITHGKNSLSDLFKNGVKYFFANLGITLLVFFSLLVVLSLLWAPFLAYSGDPIETYDTEKPYIIGIITLIILSMLLSFLGAAWKVKAISLRSTSEPQSIKKGLTYAVRNFLKIIPFGLVLLGLAAFTITLFKYLIGLCDGSTWLGVLCSAALGQFIIVGLCKLRLMFFGGVISKS